MISNIFLNKKCPGVSKGCFRDRLPCHGRRHAEERGGREGAGAGEIRDFPFKFRRTKFEYLFFQINSSPMDDGWLFKVRLEKEAEETAKLMTEEEYKKYLAAQEEEENK